MALLSNLRNRASVTDRERGAILILSALVMILLLFIAAFATDLGAWYRQGQAQQRAADVGSLNGMQAYDRGAKQYFADQGVSTWGELSAAQRTEAERAAMLEAVNTIIGLLETSGHSFSATPTEVQLSPPPNVPGDESTFTATSDDGTLVTITRTGGGMSVTLSADGDQYFSNLLRDAPQITRKSTAVLSNCGAECTRSIVINPPFAGFQGTGQGDGYGPLLYDKNPSIQGFEEVWAVNHHAGNGEIICMDVEGQIPCKTDGSQFALNYQTGNRPVEYIDSTAGKIYYAARRAGDQRTGIACFDTAARAECSTPFVGLFDQTNNPSWSGWINVNGPWRNGNELYFFTQDGQWGCVTTGMSSCGSGGTQAQATGNMADLQHSQNFVTNGEQIGSKIYVTQNTPTALVMHCFDMSNQSACWGSAQSFTSMPNGGDDHMTFFSHNSSGTPTGICTLDMINIKHGCTTIDGTTQFQIAGLNTAMAPLDAGSWGGDAFTWYGAVKTRTFFAGGNSNQVGCWDWDSGDCGSLTVDAAYSTSNNVNPYGLNQISSQCIIGLGHTSIFFSFNPIGLSACVETSVTTEILPCTCADNSNKWGEVRMPAELMAKVDAIYATVSLTAGGTALPGLNAVDLVASDGILDLGTVDASNDRLFLTLEVDAKLDIAGVPLWTSPITADLAVIVQPTLSN